ncbi:rhodanese-like domain-containing protein [Janibacter sp. YIM B02568]|uniref:rhodanese-like domain-containing protein n=1 Tax=Janibacter endophyticus TaxID=2806261 RepID=UPI001952480C|nr:rhodanese-like domain-containing protein [Janibacter endophyticus]MBM6544835.1 rhodanese-like domain-containing protein [Janibacter endophyticus]
MSEGGYAADRHLVAAREGLARLTPEEAASAQRAGALLVDTRTAAQRARQGEVTGALVIDRTVLEWRLDPTCPYRVPEAVPGVRVVVLCRQGYSSSLAAVSLRALGVDATDVIGGVESWIGAGLPVDDGPPDVRE